MGRRDNEDLLGEGTAVSAEVPDHDTRMLLQAVEQPFERVRLMEPDVGVAVTVLDPRDDAANGGHPREVAVRLLVGIFRVLLVSGYELVVKVKVDAVPGIELACGGKALQQQNVHPLVHVEGIGFPLDRSHRRRCPLRGPAASAV